MPFLGPFAGFIEKPMRATTTCLIAHDRNKYSVDAKAAGRAVLVRVYADRIVALLGEEVVADHPRSFRRDQVVYDPWHYLPVLMRKPGALGQWRAVQGLGIAGAAVGSGRKPPAPRRRRSAVREDSRPRPRGRRRRCGGGLRRGTGGRNRQWRRRPGDPRPQAATAGAAKHHDARRAQAQGRADRRLRPLRQSAQGSADPMERHQIIEAMTSLKLYGMRASFDEIAGKGLARREELYPLSAMPDPRRDHGASPVAIDQLSHQRRQVPAGKGPRRFRRSRTRRSTRSNSRTRRRRLHRGQTQPHPDRRHRARLIMLTSPCH